MSFKSWQKEFYPKEASKVSKTEALYHSLRKWVGLRKENLDKHNLIQISSSLYDENDDLVFSIDFSTCALCTHYIDNECVECPLFKARNKKCDDSYLNSPYFKFCDKKDPKPMIELIKKCI